MVKTINNVLKGCLSILYGDVGQINIYRVFITSRDKYSYPK